MKAKFGQKSRLPVICRTCCGIILLSLIVSSAYPAKVEDFMPQESSLYLKLQDIDEVCGEIEVSETWEKGLAPLTETPNWERLQKGFLLLQEFLGTDLLSVSQTVGYRTGLAVWTTADDALHMGLVVHSGGNLSELQRLLKIVEGVIGMSDTNTLLVDAGAYRRVRYNVMKMNLQNVQHVVKYGFVDEFLVLGVGAGAFEKLMDTFRKQAPSIAKNARYREIAEKSGAGQISLFCNVQQTLKDFSMHDLRIYTDKADAERATALAAGLDKLKSVEIMWGEFNLLETGEFFRLHAQLTPEVIETFNASASPPQRENPLKTFKVVSGNEETFIAVAETALSFFNNLNLKEGMSSNLKGETALSVDDLAAFNPTLKGLPQTTLAIAHVNVAGALEKERGAPPLERVFVPASEIPPLLAWVSIEGNAALLAATLSQKETSLETIAKLVPFIVWHIGGWQ